MTGDPYNCYQVDVWSLAVTLYAMLNLMTPFNVDQDDYGMKDMMDGAWDWGEELKDGPPSEGLESIMKGMLEPDPDTRLTMKQTCQHEWLVDSYEEVLGLVGSGSGSSQKSGSKSGSKK